MNVKELNYEPPKVEILEVEVENGFQTTGNPGGAGGQDWNTGGYTPI